MLLSPTQREWLDQISKAAEAGGHIFATAAACEAALESGFGLSRLAREGNNLFGTKQHKEPIFETLVIPTREYLNNEWVIVYANWVKYPDLASCFADRMATLHRLAPSYPHYAAALAATDPETFVTEVSRTWSTDPLRAEHVLWIRKAYLNL